jgi:hypothetical protein
MAHLQNKAGGVLVAIFLVAATSSRAIADAEPNSAISMLRQCEGMLRRETSTDTIVCLSKAWSVQATIATLKVLTKGFEPPYCLPRDGWSNEQAVRVFVRYANEHPDMLNLPAEGVFIVVLKASYPCSQ